MLRVPPDAGYPPGGALLAVFLMYLVLIIVASGCFVLFFKQLVGAAGFASQAGVEVVTGVFTFGILLRLFFELRIGLLHALIGICIVSGVIGFRMPSGGETASGE